jgi:hypothetical protein
MLNVQLVTDQVKPLVYANPQEYEQCLLRSRTNTRLAMNG